MSEEKSVLIFVSAQNMEAESVRALLESSGVKVQLNYDGLMPARLLLFYTQEVGGYKLFVEPSELERAVDVFQEHIEAAPGPPFYGAYSSMGASPLRWKDQAAPAGKEPETGPAVTPPVEESHELPGVLISRDAFLALFILGAIILAIIFSLR